MKSNIITLFNDEERHSTGVYKLFHTSMPDKFYIGSTAIRDGRKGKIGFARRFQSHRQYLRFGIHPSKELIDIVSKYGFGGLFMEILEICEPEVCRLREQLYMDTLQPSLNKILNSKDSSGYKHTPETLIKMRLSHLGKIMSDETRMKISATTKGRKNPECIIRLQSPEARAKRIVSLTGLKKSEESVDKRGKTVYQITLNGELVQTFATTVKAAKAAGVHCSNIIECCLGKRISSAGYKWSYYENNYSISRLKK